MKKISKEYYSVGEDSQIAAVSRNPQRVQLQGARLSYLPRDLDAHKMFVIAKLPSKWRSTLANKKKNMYAKGGKQIKITLKQFLSKLVFYPMNSPNLVRLLL